MRLLAAALAVLLVAFSAAACGRDSAAANPDAIHVVTTTTIFADLVRQVGGDLVDVHSLVPKGGEVHTFDPTPSDIRHVHEARLIVRNGLGLDDWLTNLVANAGGTGTLVTLGEDLPGVTYQESGGGAVNPHLWLDASYAKLYVDRIAEALGEADPGHAADFRARADAYGRELLALDADARARLARIPAADRTVISFHDAFPYFAAAYGLTIDGTIVDAPGQDASAAQVTALVRLIESKGIHAVFAEAQFNDDLVRTLADQTGATVVSDLYTDTLGDAPVDTYVGMMRWNVDRVERALTGG